MCLIQICRAILLVSYIIVNLLLYQAKSSDGEERLELPGNYTLRVLYYGGRPHQKS